MRHGEKKPWAQKANHVLVGVVKTWLLRKWLGYLAALLNNQHLHLLCFFIRDHIAMLGKMPSCHEVSMLNYEGNRANHLSMQCELHPKGNLDHKSSNGARCAMMVWAHSLELVVGKTFSSQSDS